MSGGWRDQAACKGMPIETFFPNPSNVKPVLGLATCAVCKVRAECRKEADSNHDLYFGVWGGATHAQRVRESNAT